MPPINQQGSRAGLVTALVVFVILFVVSAVFAFNYYGQVKQATQNLDSLQKKYNGYLSDAALGSTQVQALVTAKTEQPPHFNITPSETALDVALKQTAGLSAVISGAGTDQPAGLTADAAAMAVRNAAAQMAKAKVKLDLTAGGLDGAVKRLADQVSTDQGTIGELQGQLAAANGTVEKLTASVADVNKAKDDAAKAQHDADAQAAATDKATYDANAATLKDIQAAQDAAVKKNAADQGQVLAQAADAQQQLKAVQTEIAKLQTRMNGRRPDVTNATVRVADGELIRVPGGGVCYINLGYGTGVTNGLTFEVYDKINGVPPIPPNVTGDEQLPVGKASIEIIHVGDNSSECRIVHTEPGAVLTEGDPIENLVYDAHQKYQFDVFGSFDLGNTGRPNTADTEVIKRLVTQWGGKLTDKVSPDTDFLVLGSEPVLPEFSKDDLTPENQDKLQKAQEALDQYQEVSKEAKDLHIPILNQNRFLYYVGYYDQATR